MLVPDAIIHFLRDGTIRDAYIADTSSNKIASFQINNLHVIGYAEPINLWIPLEELHKHRNSLPRRPMALPCVTSNYS